MKRFKNPEVGIFGYLCVQREAEVFSEMLVSDLLLIHFIKCLPDECHPLSL